MSDNFQYRCKVCDTSFKKFILFEGHFDFNAKCREKHGTFLQCFECWQEFQHTAGLKYHLEYHHTKIVRKIPKVPKITLKKQWNFKNIPQSVNGITSEQNGSLNHEPQFVIQLKKQMSGRLKPAESTKSQEFVSNKQQKSADSMKSQDFANSKPKSTEFTKPQDFVSGKQKSTESTTSQDFINSKQKSPEFTKAQDFVSNKRTSAEPTNSQDSGSSKRRSIEPTKSQDFVRSKRRSAEPTKTQDFVSNTRRSAEPTKSQDSGSSKRRSIEPTKSQNFVGIKRRSAESTKSQDLVSVSSVPPAEIESTSATSSELVPNIPSNTPPKATQCHICKIKVRNSLRLEKHILCHSEGNVQCEICKIRFTGVTLYWHLKLIHKMNDPGKYKCSTCKQLCPSAETLGIFSFLILKSMLKFLPKCQISAKHEKGHRKSVIEKKVLTLKKQASRIASVPLTDCCKICKVPAKGVRLARHMQVHKYGKFKCCNIRFTVSSLIWHQKRVHPEINFSLLARQCNICKAILASPIALRKHVKVHEIGTLKCEICNIKFTPVSLMIHDRKFHPELQRSFGKQKCEVCKVTCYNRAEIESHVEMHKTGKFNCESCNISFTEKALELHKKRFHPESNATCSICNGTFSNLPQHIKVHSIGNVKCEICGIRFTLNSLAHHYKTFHPHEKLRSTQSIKLMRHNQYLNRKRIKMALSAKFQCKECKLCFHDAKKLSDHSKVHISGGLKCHICNIRFTKTSLAFHLKRFHSDVDRKKRILRALHRHIAEELKSLSETDATQIPIILEDQYQQLMSHNTMIHQCIICKLPCGLGSKLDNHMMVHIEGEYKCQFCNIWFTKISLERHQKRFHLEFYEERTSNGIKLVKELGEDIKENTFADERQTSHRCDICRSECGGEEKLAQHKQMHITGKVECEICQIRFSECAYRYHRNRYHPELRQAPKAPEMLQCSICKIKCSDSKRLEVHMTVHTEADTECDICNIPYTKAALNIHNRRMHPHIVPDHVNEIIRKALARNPSASGAALRHVTGESSETGFPCTICEMNFVKQKDFFTHMKIHAYGDLRCPVCQTWFTKMSLDYHCKRFHPELTIAKGPKDQLQCDKCPYICTEPARLQDHMKVHQGNLKCVICNIVFTKAGLVYHYKQFHPNTPKKDRILRAIENYAAKKALHNCDKCGKSFTRICYLTLHRNRKCLRNIQERNPIPIDCKIVLDCKNVALSNNDVGSGETEAYQCYVCREEFTSVSQLKYHLSSHLAIKAENGIEEADFDQMDESSSDRMDIETEGGADHAILSEVDIQNLMTMENGGNDDQPSTSQSNNDEVIEIISSDDDDEDYATIRYQMNNANLRMKQEPSSMHASNGGPSTWDSSCGSGYNQVDVSQTFYCYFCNKRCNTLVELGEHEKICNIKLETIY
ncbi:Zinc finger protein [Pseudolycoriella hygida]|uniref:Zinc finger protein n=1 Tax=Pseudolycoriella hygida TaxID=35572 RepID=A0A9Q0MPN6_9DIPT|nr:Zinc finger protein [Pseudolycoriella hygida]